jgi:hypothetical protein
MYFFFFTNKKKKENHKGIFPSFDSNKETGSSWKCFQKYLFEAAHLFI